MGDEWLTPAAVTDEQARELCVGAIMWSPGSGRLERRSCDAQRAELMHWIPRKQQVALVELCAIPMAVAAPCAISRTPHPSRRQGYRSPQRMGLPPRIGAPEPEGAEVASSPPSPSRQRAPPPLLRRATQALNESGAAIIDLDGRPGRMTIARPGEAPPRWRGVGCVCDGAHPRLRPSPM